MAELDNIKDDRLLLESDISDQILGLAGIRDLRRMLNQGLQLLINIMRAEAGSLFFSVSSPQYVRIGLAPPQILEHVNQWEQAVADRLQSGTWRIPPQDTPPISIHHYPELTATLINTPILLDTQVVGSLSLILSQQKLLSPARQTLLNRLARSLGQLGSLAAELSQTQKRHSELDLIYRMSQVLTTTLDQTDLLQNILELTAHYLDAAAASILLVDEDRKELVFEICYGPRRELIHRQRIGLSEGVAGWVASHDRAVVVNEPHTDPRFSRRFDQRTGFLTASIAAVPIKLKGKVVGALEALNKNSETGFDDNDLQLMAAIAAQAAITLENARLYHDIREERDRIITAQEEIRRELSRNLHDGTVQKLSAISMNLDYIQQLLNTDPEAARQEITSIQNLVHKATKEARLVLFELRPVILETQGLIPALERYVAQLNEDEAFNIQADLSPLLHPIDGKVAGTIFSIIQEAINNAKRHAKATLTKITVTSKGEQLLVYIQDNGVGFDVSTIQADYASRNSFGLLNMKERAELIEGILTIISETTGSSQGTMITLTVPLKPGTGPLKRSLVGK